MLLEIDIPEEMLESEILDAIVYVDTDRKVIKKVHIEPRAEDYKNVLNKIKEEIKDNTNFINVITEKEGIDFEVVEKIIDKYKAESEEV